ncbi:MAG TPA: N-acetylmuramoyl-L-alanine amidase [Roseiflexaceae bacterium]|nr:N-acetylmuramoyl-L-alanine amidase [Roseiflexaceae bacterium]
MSGNGWCPFAERIPSPNFTAGHGSLALGAVVEHIIQGTLTSAISEFLRGRRGVSAHFGIGRNGRIVQFVSINNSSHANGLSWSEAHSSWIDPEGSAVDPSWAGLIVPHNPALYTLSIEHEGRSGQPWTPAMFAASARVHRWIRSVTGLTYIPRQTMIGHYEISPKARARCPGPTVEWDRLAEAGNGVEVPATRWMQVINPCSSDPADNWAAVRQGPGINPKTKQLYPIALGGTARLNPGTFVEIDQVRADGWSHLANGWGFVATALLRPVK